MISTKPLLGPEHLQQIRTGLQAADIALAHVEQAKRAGIDVSAQEKQIAEHKTKLLALKNAYFPGQ